jgi:predicted O-linked N-acetylglucosamine transferase (SPINDLY family)
MAASLLQAIDLPELVTATAQDYERLAFELATQPAKLAQLKRKLTQHRESAPLFDTESFTKHIEIAYQRAYQRYFDGMEPDVIEVE